MKQNKNHEIEESRVKMSGYPRTLSSGPIMSKKNYFNNLDSPFQSFNNTK